MQTPKRLAAAVAATTILTVVGLPTVYAHKGAKGIVKERMMSMKMMGDGMKQLAAMVTGKVPYDAVKTKTIAAILKKHAEGIPKQFPKGSIRGPSEALPSIWKSWDEFKQHADALTGAADKLGSSANNGKAVALGLFAQMGKSCSGCHDDFRKKKE